MNQILQNRYSPFLFLSPHRIKFLLSVADDYEWICPAPTIFYDPITYLPTFCIDRLHQEYRADFLIRHRDSGQAMLIDLYPSSMAGDARLLLHRRIAGQYISWKRYDWKYRCLFQEYVEVTPNESLLFDLYYLMTNHLDHRKWLTDYMAMVQVLKPAVFQSQGYSVLDFLIHGVLPQTI